MEAINKNSGVDDICKYLNNLGIKKHINKFKEEKIKGNEIFYLTDEDFVKLKMKAAKDYLKGELNKIKINSPDILKFNEIIYSDSKNEEIINFLKNEILLEEDILVKFRDISGEKFKKLKEEDLITIGLKLGERRKILAYIPSMRPKPTIKRIDPKNISSFSKIEEVCFILNKRFSLSKEILDKFRKFGIDGKKFLEMEQEDLDEFDIEEEIQKKIMDYIKERNLEPEEEEEREDEDNFKCFQLIDIEEYLTSDDEYNKCPFNKTEGFIDLCNYFSISNKENCSYIGFDEANSKQLKVSTLWGAKDALLEFFSVKNMKNIYNQFKNNNNDSGGIYLLINEQKSFAYVVIWPGKMKYFHRRLEEPKKELLLSLVRMGFSLSDNSVICLTEKQEQEFQITNGIESKNIYEVQEGNLKNRENENDYFQFDDELKINFENNIIGKIKDFKLNDSSIFFYISTKEKIDSLKYENMPLDKININVKNVIINKNFNLTDSKLYNFLKHFNCLKDLIQEEEYIKIKNLYEKKLNCVKEKANKLENYIQKIISCIPKISCEICLKVKRDSLFACYTGDNSFTIAHDECLKRNNKLKDTPKKNLTNKSIKEMIKELICLFNDNENFDNCSYLKNKINQLLTI